MPIVRSNRNKVGGESDPETPDNLKDVLLSDGRITNSAHKNDTAVEQQKPGNKTRQQSNELLPTQTSDDNFNIIEETTKENNLHRHPTNRRKQKAVFGSGKDCSAFKAAQRRTWMYMLVGLPQNITWLMLI
nr:unnamed protein product [Callosobruchus analis]